MTDFTIEYHQQCSPELNIGGYQQWYHIGKLECSCKGFQFRRTCKHVKELEETMCGWHSAWSDEIQTPEQEKERICPVCGGHTEIVRVAV